MPPAEQRQNQLGQSLPLLGVLPSECLLLHKGIAALEVEISRLLLSRTLALALMRRTQPPWRETWLEPANPDSQSRIFSWTLLACLLQRVIHLFAEAGNKVLWAQGQGVVQYPYWYHPSSPEMCSPPGIGYMRVSNLLHGELLLL